MHDVCVCTIGFIDLSVSRTSTYSAQRFSSCETSTPTMTVYIFFAMLLIPKSILSSAYATVALKNRFPGNKSSMNDALTSRCPWGSACVPAAPGRSRRPRDLGSMRARIACVRGSHPCSACSPPFIRSPAVSRSPHACACAHACMRFWKLVCVKRSLSSTARTGAARVCFDG